MRALLLALLLLPGSALAQKTVASMDCRHTGKDFTYDCRIKINRGGEPLSGAQVTVGADMPSMPLAHNTKPVKAHATKTPGEYRARLELEMTGEWAVKLRLAGPVRDQLVLHYEFDERGARALKGSAPSPRK
jgi:YtkA-like protein